MKRNRLKLSKKYKSDKYWDDLAEVTAADIEAADAAWNEGAVKLRELLESTAPADDIEDGENA